MSSSKPNHEGSSTNANFGPPKNHPATISSIPPGLVAGIVVVLVILIVALLALLIVVYLKLRKKRESGSEVLDPGLNNGMSGGNDNAVMRHGHNNPLDVSWQSDVSPRSTNINFNSSVQDDDHHYVPRRPPPSIPNIPNQQEEPHYVKPGSPSRNNLNSSWQEDPHYVAPRTPSPSNNQKLQKYEEPHYVSPRSPNINNQKRGRHEEPHYASPRSPNLTPSHSPTRMQNKELGDYDRPLSPRPVQKTEDQSHYDYLGQPKPVKTERANKKSFKLSARGFKSPFASAAARNESQEETEPVYANT